MIGKTALLVVIVYRHKMLVWRRLFFHHELNVITDMTFVIEHLVVSVRELLPEEIERRKKVKSKSIPLSFNDWVQIGV